MEPLCCLTRSSTRALAMQRDIANIMSPFPVSRITSSAKGKGPMRRHSRDVGKLMQVLNVPLDVFFEVGLTAHLHLLLATDIGLVNLGQITSHLDPMDILQLSRVSIQLRRMLHSRSSRHIWIAARRNVSPPPPNCPDFLSEPEYAYLLFEVHCVVSARLGPMGFRGEI